MVRSYYKYENGNMKREVIGNYQAEYWNYTEEGYLMFSGVWFSEELYVLTLSGAEEHTALRVQPLDETYRELSRKYLNPISFERNNMFIVDWSEEDFGDLNFYDMYDILYPKVNGQYVPYVADDNLSVSAVYRIPKEEFERWYRSQSRHRTAADRERDREIEAQTISIPEMAKLLGIPREKVYWILDCKKYRDCFVIERVADRPRITKKSFKAWLKSQSTYQLQKPKKETHEEPPLKLQCPKNGKYYSFQEIQAFYGISRPTLDSWVLKEGIPTMQLGRGKRIQKDAFDEVLKSKRKVEEDV